ncbi:hypothetical protein F2P81_023101 [Scophthalmus maximus]|uniref:Transmembrane protein n=1 Tax=Scophthalmus maximus TaxID=52904 RepID=A0A6A4RVI9_SCOMX|nr:hypothetical protein F2P81_023101 [Scophthalmus maximus]
MPASPPGNVFPALVALGHVVTLIVVWRLRTRKKEVQTILYERHRCRQTDTGAKVIVGLNRSGIMRLFEEANLFF